MTSTLRQKRVADRLQVEISELFQREMNDPRLELVTVTRVNIDRELEYAHVFVSTVGDEARQAEVLAILKGAHGFIRREIGRRVQLRRTPQLVFHWDPAPEKGEQVEQLLDKLRAENQAPTDEEAEADSEHDGE